MATVSTSTIEDVVKNIGRFRILCVGRTGVGKSSLINRVFGVTGTKVSEYTIGEASIDQEFVSDENEYFVLHDSKGFEAGDDENFDVVAQFLRERRAKERMEDRLHAIWLCVQTPHAGGRVLEEGDKKLLALARELESLFFLEARARWDVYRCFRNHTLVPVVVVFTKYDLLVLAKQLDEDEDMDEETLRATSLVKASKAMIACVDSLDIWTIGLKIPTPPYAAISVSRGYEDSITDLVNTTLKVVRESLEYDAWVVWAVAQRASLPAKIETCVDRGVNFYFHALAGCIPCVGNMLLWQCLARVHEDIITCWNFKDEQKILNGEGFKQLMLYLVHDLWSQSPTPAPHIDTITHFVNMITAAHVIPFAPPVAILGLSYYFLEWFSRAILQRIPEVECLLMAYTIDLISVLRSLFDFTLKPDLAGKTDWEVLQEAFTAYHRSNARKENHDSCRSLYGQNDRVLTRQRFRQEIKKLLDESLGLEVKTNVQ